MLTGRLAEHIATALARSLPADIEIKAKQHLLDTIAAMVSGSRLAPGEKAIAFARLNQGPAEATIAGSDLRTGMVQAALANGMLGHADETDDSHAPSLTHPGCAVVPAALAVAEARNRCGRDLLRSVVVGYDVGPRISMALGGERFFIRHHSSHAVGGLFGAAAAAGALFGLSQRQCRSLLGYGVQMASGNASWRRDPDHIEKAFDFGGMPAMNGVLAASMVASGMTGVPDALDGAPSLFSAFPDEADPPLAVRDLGGFFEISRTAIKKWCVGSPIQAALDALEMLMAQHAVAVDQIDRIVVSLPETSARVVDDRDMPDVNMQYQLAVMLIDGAVSFASSHDRTRLKDPDVVSLKQRIRLDPHSDPEFLEHTRQAIVTIRLRDGHELTQKVRHVRGTPKNPMENREIVAKAIDLMRPVLGETRSQEIVERVMNVENERDAGDLARLLRTD